MAWVPWGSNDQTIRPISDGVMIWEVEAGIRAG
jgi:hypothetical protein